MAALSKLKLTAREAANLLGVSPNTVYTTRRRLRQRLGLEQDADLWDFAFSKRVLLATPTNLIAIARTVSAVWKQEKMAGQAREIAELGKELYARLATMGGHVGRMGKNLDTAVSA